MLAAAGADVRAEDENDRMHQHRDAAGCRSVADFRCFLVRPGDAPHHSVALPVPLVRDVAGHHRSRVVEPTRLAECLRELVSIAIDWERRS
jgi:hypothetical protein